ncbi:phytoene/squalene synthase family protein [Haladaptatus caseinilyticus]|uniref:phytoene/squalene synthase family protein n=1 Tax=Haladaptatus caseinilyticus TaxID=2993314 RepID=UPI00224A5728|nr:phytoene/squalene synthase family protein [Haladaptatus caseinilyticus]
MVTERQLTTSKTIHRRTGRTFYVATRLLPKRVRHPTYVLYAFFRTADEVVDDAAGVSPDEQRVELERLREQALGRESPDDPVLAAFREVADEHDIPDAEIEMFIDAMQTDIEKARYATYGELESYMRGSAAAVGRMMVAIMDTADPEWAGPHATALGEAFQLTNFLRDVREDIVERNRIYLPQTTLERHGVTNEQIIHRDHSESFSRVIRDELRRAESLYWKGVNGIQYLPEDCQFAVLLASVLYAEHHRLIRGHEYDVLSTTPQLSLTRRLWVLVRTRWHWRISRDPETVFRAVSSIPEANDYRAGTGAPAPVR